MGGNKIFVFVIWSMSFRGLLMNIKRFFTVTAVTWLFRFQVVSNNLSYWEALTVFSSYFCVGLCKFCAEIILWSKDTPSRGEYASLFKALFIHVLFRFVLVWLVSWVLWHINLCRLFNAKSIFGLVWFGLVWLVGFYGISTFVGYLTPNPFLVWFGFLGFMAYQPL